MDKTFILQLTTNMYGLKQAGRNWYNHLHTALTAIGFAQSKVDKCLFFQRDCILVVYVDDCLIFSKDDQILESIITHLGTGFRITSNT
jgi:hypothetical protein